MLIKHGHVIRRDTSCALNDRFDLPAVHIYVLEDFVSYCKYYHTGPEGPELEG